MCRLAKYNVLICTEALINAVLILFFHLYVSFGFAICQRLI